MNERPVIFPWDDSKYPKDRLADRSNIYAQLRRLEYPIDRYKSGKFKDKERLILVSKDLIKHLTSNDWVLFLTNSSLLIHSLSELFPIVFALSTARSVFGIDNSSLADLIYTADNEREVSAIKNSGLVVFNNFGENSRRLINNTSSILPIFESRLSKSRKLLMLSFYGGGNPSKSKNSIIDRLNDIYGHTISSLVRENSKFVHFKTSDSQIIWDEPVDRSSDI